MDQLTRDAIAAQKAGLSYGRYMATKEQKPSAVRYPKKQAQKKVTDPSSPAAPQNDDLVVQSADPRCKLCGEPVPRDYKGRKYCSAACADEARRQQVREHNHRARAARLAELAAGRENT